MYSNLIATLNSNLGIELEFKGLFSSVLNGLQPWLL